MQKLVFQFRDKYIFQHDTKIVSKVGKSFKFIADNNWHAIFFITLRDLRLLCFSTEEIIFFWFLSFFILEPFIVTTRMVFQQFIAQWLLPSHENPQFSHFSEKAHVLNLLSWYGVVVQIVRSCNNIKFQSEFIELLESFYLSRIFLSTASLNKSNFWLRVNRVFWVISVKIRFQRLF